MTNSDPPAQRYADLDALVRQLAGQIGESLTTAIALRGRASLIVSGGKSPIPLFESLRAQPLDWSCVCVGLADERWVEPADADSNERLVREVLLRDRAAAARFAGLKNSAATPDAGEAAAWETYATVPRPFDVVILGMGDDGHTASLFPKSPRLPEALRAEAAAACIAMQAPSAPRERMSLNLTALLDSRRIVILLTGESKWRTYAAASEPGPVEAMPIRAVLRQRRTPVDVFWSP